MNKITNKHINKIISFLKKIERFKKIERKVYLSPDRAETDAEHAWHLAMFVILFRRELPKNLNYSRMLELALVHDLVEIYAGDTFTFDYENRKTKKKREALAAKKLFSGLPADLKKKFQRLFREFEECKTREAKYVKTFDNLQPMMQNILGKGETFKKFNIKFAQIDNHSKKHMDHDGMMLEIYKKLLGEIKRKKLAK